MDNDGSSTIVKAHHIGHVIQTFYYPVRAYIVPVPLRTPTLQLPGVVIHDLITR